MSVSCTNSRASDLAAAARVFREASPAKIPDSVKFYIAAASMPEQRAAEEVSVIIYCFIYLSELRGLSQDRLMFFSISLLNVMLTGKY